MCLSGHAKMRPELSEGQHNQERFHVEKNKKTVSLLHVYMADLVPAVHDVNCLVLIKYKIK